MSNMNKLEQVFADTLKVDINIVQNDLQYNSIKQWDSIAHMALVTSIEDAFDIMLDTSDIVDMSSVAKAKEIVAKHGVTL